MSEESCFGVGGGSDGAVRRGPSLPLEAAGGASVGAAPAPGAPADVDPCEPSGDVGGAVVETGGKAEPVGVVGDVGLLLDAPVGTLFPVAPEEAGAGDFAGAAAAEGFAEAAGSVCATEPLAITSTRREASGLLYREITADLPRRRALRAARRSSSVPRERVLFADRAP